MVERCNEKHPTGSADPVWSSLEPNRRLRMRATMALVLCTLGAATLLVREPGRNPLLQLRLLAGRALETSSSLLERGSASGIPAPARGGDRRDGGDDGGGGGLRLATGIQQLEQPAVAMWEEGEAFYAPHSRCTVKPDGSVAYDPAPVPASGMPFLFDTSQYGSQEFRVRMCGKAAGTSRYRGRYDCFGPCIFQSRLCDQIYKGSNKSQEVVVQYQAAGWRFGELSPCELFQRIRGRTLWFIGDSQTCHFFFAAECFLREFAPTLKRRPAFPKDINMQLNTHDPPIYPLCLNLAHGTRVCQLRVDEGRTLVRHVLPLMVQKNPRFADDIVLFNFGLHYGARGKAGFLEDIALVKQWRAKRGAAGRPQMVWMDVPLQHFDSLDGRFNSSLGKKKGELQCRNLTAWYQGDKLVLAGGEKNKAAQRHIPKMADGHLRTWNESAPLWDVHMSKGDCTHYCSPTAYHIWLFLLNRELGRSRVGAPVRLRQAPGDGAGSGGGDGALGGGGGEAPAAGGGREAEEEQAVPAAADLDDREEDAGGSGVAAGGARDEEEDD